LVSFVRPEFGKIIDLDDALQHDLPVTDWECVLISCISLPRVMLVFVFKLETRAVKEMEGVCSVYGMALKGHILYTMCSRVVWYKYFKDRYTDNNEKGI
jgi:hypothetical protein